MVSIPFGRDAKFALAGAFEVAREVSNQEVRCEHLVIGLSRAAPTLFFDEAAAEQIEAAVRKLLARRPKARRPPSPGTLRYDEPVKQCLRDAQEAARKRRADAVDGGDLLGAVLMAADQPLVGVLEESGVRLPSQPRPTEWADTPGDASPLVRLSDDSPKPFYDQVAQQIKAAIAEGRLIPGDRIPPVRRLADALDLAPGTVARAYRQLEADRIVETDGARGTFVAPPRRSGPKEHSERLEMLAGLLRPTAVAAFHFGASATELSQALDIAVRGVFTPDAASGSS